MLISPAVGGVVANIGLLATTAVFQATVYREISGPMSLSEFFAMIGSVGFLLSAGIIMCFAYVAALPMAFLVHAVFFHRIRRKLWQYIAMGAAISLGAAMSVQFLIGGWYLVSGSAAFLAPSAVAGGACGAALFWAIAIRPGPLASSP